MSFSLPDHWVWDFWFADDGERFHLYYLHAPHALGDPDLRHRNARIGHAVSQDLAEWTDVGPCIQPSGGDAVDATATWTGSVVRHPDGRWLMFYTGSRFLAADSIANIETIVAAESDDLHTWRPLPHATLSADAEYYETFDSGTWREEAWRDPWVFQRPDGRWGMLVTARARHGGDPDDRGVVGYAESDDALTWQARPALSEPNAGFSHVEVPQLVDIDGASFLLFSCDTAALAGHRRASGHRGGVWAIPITDITAGMDLRDAHLVMDEEWYAGRAVRDRSGKWHLMAFANGSSASGFGGWISDPMPLSTRDGRLIASAERTLIA